MSGASLGGLTVFLAADTAGFQTDMGRAARIAQQGSDEIKKHVGQMATAVAAGIAATAAAALTSVHSAIEAGDKLNKLSQKVGNSAENLSVWKQQAELADVALESLQGGMIKLAKATVEAAGGTGEQAKAFKAMGISVVDASGKLKSNQQVLDEVATKMAGYRDSTSKAALSTVLFGKSGADLIPLLNAVGKDGFDKARKTAEDFGAVISTDMARKSEEFNDNLTLLKMGAQGLGNAIASRLVGPLAEYTTMLVAAARGGDKFAETGEVIANAVKGVIVGVSIAKNTIESLVNVLAAVHGTTKAVFTGLSELITVWAQSMGEQMKAAFTFDFEGAAAAGERGRAALQAVLARTAIDIKTSWSSAGTGLTEAVHDIAMAYTLFGDQALFASKSATEAADEAAKTEAPWRDHEAAQKAAADQTSKLAAAELRLAEIIAGLRGAVDPVKKAWDDSAKAMRDAAAQGAVMIAQGQKEADVQRKVQVAVDEANAARERSLAAIAKQGDVLGRYLDDAKSERALIGMTERQKAIARAVQTATEKWEANTQAMRPNKQTLEELQAGVAATEGALYDQAKAVEAAQAQVQRYADIVRGAFDSMIDATADWAVNGFKDAKGFWKGMVDTAKRAIAQLLAEWAKTKIIGFFTGSSAAGGGGFWSTLIAGAASMFGGGTGGSSSGGSVAQAAGGFMQNYAANTARGAVTGGGAASGGGSSAGGVGNAAWGYFGQFASSGAGAATAAAAPWLGAVGGAFYGARQGDGGLGTAGAITAGVIAGYYAGTVAASAITYAGAAYAATAGAGAATAGAATAGGAAAGASAGVAAIPIVGWIAALALIVDKVTGGKIFGSKYRPESVKETINFGKDGATATAFMTEWRYRSQLSQAFGRFGGALLPSDWGDKDRRGRSIPVDPAALAAIKKVFEALEKTAARSAAFIGTEAIKILDASFETKTVYDKKGRVKRTESFGTILGKRYEEEWEKFQVRMHAETIIATVGQLDTMASQIAEAYRKDADVLMDAAAVMLQAQRDISNNQQLLGAGRGLESTMAWLEKQRAGDETLVQTYQRLAQATAQYRDLLSRADDAMRQLSSDGGPVSQMRDALDQIRKNYEDNVAALNAAAVAAGLTAAAEKDLAKLRDLQIAQINKISQTFFADIDAQIAALTRVNTPAGDFAAQMRAIHKAMLDNIAMANLVARAAGYQGASEQQLARIHELAARQAAAAIKQLNDLARQQARSLGYLGPQSVSEIDARLAEFQAREDAAAQAMQGFGAAMTSVAQEATNAMNLLLGNLSPLNDQQKLQVALQGLYAGTASQEQVLEIGRRLFASSQRYVDLFNQVMGVRPRNLGGGGGSGRSDPANKPKPLTAAEIAERDALREQRAIQVKQERYLEANEFANTIASIAAAQGVSFEDVAKQIGFNLEDLAKDLGMSQDDLLKYLSNIDVNQDAIPDSITSNTDRILARLDLYWGGDDENPPQAQPPENGRNVNLPLDPIRGELAAGREEATRERRDVIAAMNRTTDAVNRLVDVTIEGNDYDEPRNVRDWGTGVPRR